MLKVWKVWITQGCVSNNQAITFLTNLLETMDGLAPSFRLRLEYALECCHSYAGTERRSYNYGWKPELNESKKGDDNDWTISHIPKLLIYMKKLAGNPDQLPSRLLRERLAVCMNLIRRLSQKSDESVHVHVLLTLTSMKQVYHVLPRDLIFRYLSSCSRLKSREYLAPWISVFDGLLDQIQPDWVEECVILESLEYYARHTLYPDTLKHLFQKHERLKDTFLSFLTMKSSSYKDPKKKMMIPLNWHSYTQMMTLVYRSQFIHPEEIILSRLRDFIKKREEKLELETLRRLDQKLEEFMIDLRHICSSHHGDSKLN